MSFIETYLQYTETTEPPVNFNLFTAYGVISSLIGGKVWAEVNDSLVVYPNLYILYVAEPGKRKTTAMSLGRRLIKEIIKPTPLIGEKDLIPFASSATSTAAFIQTLHSCERPLKIKGQPSTLICPMTVCASELASLLLVSSADMIGALTDLYDPEPYEYKTIAGGKFHIAHPYLVIMGCAVPKWITSQLKTDIISGGFSRRAIVIYETAFRKQSLKTRRDAALWKELVNSGRQILKMQGPLRWEDGCLDRLDQWYLNQPEMEDPLMQGYNNSKLTQIVKLAICNAVSNLDMTMRYSYIESAMRHLAIVEPNMPRAFRGLGRNPNAPLYDEIVEFITNNGGMALQSELIRQFHRDAQGRELHDVLDQLVGAQRIIKGTTPQEVSNFGVKEIRKISIYCTPDYERLYLKQKEQQRLQDSQKKPDPQ